jgi:hypothetical protein
MSTGWIFVIAMTALGFVDLVLGFVFSRTPEPPVGAPPPVGGEEALRARRFTGRMMVVGALLIWGIVAAAATGHLGPELALPMFGGPAS